jgi:hypothetical protein
MTGHVTELSGLNRDQLLAVAHDYMLSGLIMVKAVTPLVIFHAGLPPEEIPQLSIEQWMGASPVYTGRMRSLMGIGGDDVPAIMKALQLDVGFVHQYMDVRYQVDDPTHGEFWLPHCGALLDVEPFGEQEVFNMCHTIEDPTFDATALATNPRARIRPIHRPPRIPSDQQPHCRWTLVIDEANEPVGPISATEQVMGLALASVPNERSGDRADGSDDYRGPFDPGFKLRHLSSSALLAAAREFQVQTHLLVASNELALAKRMDLDEARKIQDEGWLSSSWIFAERLARLLDLGDGVEAVAGVLALTPAIPPGIDRTVEVDSDRIQLVLSTSHEGLLDPSHPGWAGSLGRGVTTGVEGTARGLGMDVRSVEAGVERGTISVEMALAPAEPNQVEPDSVMLSRIGQCASWTFDLT